MARRSWNKTWKGSYLNELAEAMTKFLPQKGVPLTTHKTNARWTPRMLAAGVARNFGIGSPSSWVAYRLL